MLDRAQASGRISFPWEAPPTPGDAIEVAEGVLWLRLPLPMTLDHVNVYALDEGDSWTIVDAGMDTPDARAQWEAILAGPMGGKPVSRVILTHHHPDHVGLAGWFIANGAELWTTTTAYLTARMLYLDKQEEYPAENVAFWTAAGMDPELIAERRTQRPFNLADCAAPIPLGHRALHEGEHIKVGGRDWVIRIGQGHAPDHATLWCVDEPLVLGGDQILPGISPNVSVYPTEPDADPLGGWIDSCARFAKIARPDQLLLGGHKLPFRGLPKRLAQLEVNHHNALDRLHDLIAEPKMASECFGPLFARKITKGIYGLALGESYAHLAHLRHQGRATRWVGDNGAYLWQAI